MQVRTALTLVIATVVLTSSAGAALGAGAAGTSGLASAERADGHAGNATVNATAAEETARDALANRSELNWTLVETDLHEDDGYYEFEFTPDATNVTGEAEFRVNATTGTLFRADISTEPGQEDEHEREVRSQPDNDTSVTVNRSDARSTALNSLSNPDSGTWTLVESKLHEDDGYYEFEFALDSGNATGDAEVRVDASSGDAFRVEEEIEPLDENESETEQEDEQETETEQEDEQETETEQEDEQETETEQENEEETEDEQEDETENEQEDEQEDETENEQEDEQDE